VTNLALGLVLGGPAISRPIYTFVNPEAAAFVARITVPPSNRDKQLYDNVFTGLKAIGLSKFIAFGLPASQDSQAARLNMISTSFGLTVSGAPVFTAYQGYAGDGVDDYLTTGFLPATNGGSTYTLNSAHIMGWARNNVASLGTLIGCGGTFAVQVDPRRSGDTCVGVCNNTTSFSASSITTSVGMTLISRTGATSSDLRRNKASIATDATASSGLPQGVVSLLARGGASQFSTSQVAAWSIGGGLTSGESDALYDVVFAYLTAVGAA
jgi:hypothetical protein